MRGEHEQAPSLRQRLCEPCPHAEHRYAERATEHPEHRIEPAAERRMAAAGPARRCLGLARWVGPAHDEPRSVSRAAMSAASRSTTCSRDMPSVSTSTASAAGR
ncbi:MAG: hypothetical protein ACK55I_37690, partial [bacterium]